MGSYWAMLSVAALFFLLLRRVVIEDRFLKENLDGYTDYSQRVRYRLLPGIW